MFRSGWLDAPATWNDESLREEFTVLKQLRSEANQLMEQARMAKTIRSSLEATIEIEFDANESSSSSPLESLVQSYADDLKKLFITSDVKIVPASSSNRSSGLSEEREDHGYSRDILIPRLGACRMKLHKAQLHKCPRCWTFTSPEADTLCGRCEPVVASASV